MHILLRFAMKTAANAGALYVLGRYLAGFSVQGGLKAFFIGGAVLAFISLFIRPVVRLLTAPFVWLTLGLFNFVINILLLWATDYFLAQMQIIGLGTLFLASVALALVNAFF